MILMIFQSLNILKYFKEIYICFNIYKKASLNLQNTSKFTEITCAVNREYQYFVQTI